MRTSKLCVLVVVMYAGSVSAQEKKPAEHPPDLSLTSVGRQHHAIKTKSAEAQAYFDQGITLLYGFNHEEAARAFRRAGELDSALPMPLWGIALAAGPTTTWMWTGSARKWRSKRCKKPRSWPRMPRK